MKSAAAENSEFRRKHFAPRFVVFVTALAFLLQSFITQTHIHGAPEGLGNTKISDSIAPGHDKSPLDHSKADCPLCQAVAHAGAFVTPVMPSLSLTLSTAGVALFITARALAARFAHNWQSRAPPLG